MLSRSISDSPDTNLPAPPSGADIQINRLPELDLNELRRIWLKTLRRPAPKGFRRDMLIKALAYELQVKAEGGLPASVKAQLRQLAVGAREGRFDETMGLSALKAGTLLVRLWQGETHRVMVMENGYAWNGEQFTSLSTIAKRITGTSWNGWTFFGVKKPKARNKNAARKNAVMENAPAQRALRNLREITPAASAASARDHAHG